MSSSREKLWAPAPSPGRQPESMRIERQRPPSAAARIIKRSAALGAIALALILFMGAGDTLDKRFNTLGHKLMCKCGCNQVLLECNHVGCTYSDRMRNELAGSLQKGDNDDLALQAF